jgi:hypothetical protein
MNKPNNSPSDTTIADIHKTREKISDRFDGNIRAISEDARKRQQESRSTTVSYAKSASESVAPKQS